MKHTFLPFQIGEEYENWEFDLDVLETERVPGCDSYTFAKIVHFISLASTRTELLFCLDILEIVILYFETDEPKHFLFVKNFLSNTMLENTTDYIDCESYTYYLNNEEILKIINVTGDPKFKVVYGNKKFVNLINEKGSSF